MKRIILQRERGGGRKVDGMSGKKNRGEMRKGVKKRWRE